VTVANAAGLGATGGANNTIVSNSAAVGVSGGVNVLEALTLNGTGISNGGALRNLSGDNEWRGGILLGVGGARINSDAGLLTITTNPITGTGEPLTIGGAGNVLIGGGFSNLIGTGNGSLTKDGAGVLTIGNTNALWTGTLTINGGIVSIGASGNLGNSGSVIIDGGTLRRTHLTNGNAFLATGKSIEIGVTGGSVDVATGGVALLYEGTITGSGNTLTKVGVGEFRVQGANTANYDFTRLVVNQGLYRIGNVAENNFETGFGAAPGAPLADAITLNNNGAIGASFGITLNVNRGITLGTGGGSFNTAAGAMVVPGVITGAGDLNKNTAGTLTLSGANTYTGATNISAGTLAAGAVNTIPLASPVVLSNVSGAVFNLAGFDQTIASLAGGGGSGGNVTLGSATLTVGVSNASTAYGGAISGAGGVTKAGSGQWTLSGANSYTGATTINEGTLVAGAANTLSPGSAVTVATGGTLNLNNFSQTIASLAGSGTVNFGSAFPTVLSTGGSNASTTFSGLITGVGQLTKTGSGTMILSGNNSYDGNTNVNGGTLLVNGQTGSNSGTGTTSVFVNNGGAFGGTGRSDGLFQVNTGGTLRGGDENLVGTLTLNGNLSLSNGATLGFRVNDLTPTTAALSSGGSTEGTLPNPTSNNFIHVTAGTVSADIPNWSSLIFTVDGTGTPFVVGETYSYQIANMVGNDMSGITTSPSQFVATGFTDPTLFSITGNGGAVYLNISPVPEPATVLGLSAGALALGGYIRRRVRGQGAALQQ
jgi:fibronectin-binding autotransporter adhesin